MTDKHSVRHIRQHFQAVNELRSTLQVDSALDVESTSLEAVNQSFSRHLPFMHSGSPSAVASVHLALGTEEKHRESQIVIKGKQVQIFSVDAGQPHPDKAVGEIVNSLQTDNLPVKFVARQSRLAAEDHHQRLAGFLRQPQARGQAGAPAVSVRARLADSSAALAKGDGIALNQSKQRQEYK